jgi:hypothetical protein
MLKNYFCTMRKMKVLYSVLDWGLGHATRSIPVIRALIDAGHTVILAGEGRSFLLLKEEFPQCQFENLKGFRVNYPEKGMGYWLLRNLPEMLHALQQEKKQTRKLVRIHQPDLLFSDHRYGFYDPQVPSYFLAHQLRIRAGWFSGLLFRLHRILIDKFDAVWVPDYENTPGLSGDLAHHPSVKSAFNLSFTGPLSRIREVLSVTPDRKYDVLILLSGPEPQRTNLEKICIEQLKNSTKQILLLQGKPESAEISSIGSITVQPGASAGQLKGWMETTPVIICRPGYSTLMDLDATGRNALFIPTPGQTEQEYLARLHSKRGCRILNQAMLDLPSAINSFQPLFHIATAGEEVNLNTLIQEVRLNN